MNHQDSHKSFKINDQKQGSFSNQDRSRPEISSSGSIVASWAEKLRGEGVPESLVDLMKKAEFEQWALQDLHKKGSGLFYTDDFQDLPPRFKKKIIEIAYQLSHQLCSREEFISKISNNSITLADLEQTRQQKARSTEGASVEAKHKSDDNVDGKWGRSKSKGPASFPGKAQPGKSIAQSNNSSLKVAMQSEDESISGGNNKRMNNYRGRGNGKGNTKQRRPTLSINDQADESKTIAPMDLKNTDSRSHRESHNSDRFLCKNQSSSEICIQEGRRERNYTSMSSEDTTMYSDSGSYCKRQNKRFAGKNNKYVSSSRNRNCNNVVRAHNPHPRETSMSSQDDREIHSMLCWNKQGVLEKNDETRKNQAPTRGSFGSRNSFKRGPLPKNCLSTDEEVSCDEKRGANSYQSSSGQHKEPFKKPKNFSHKSDRSVNPSSKSKESQLSPSPDKSDSARFSNSTKSSNKDHVYSDDSTWGHVIQERDGFKRNSLCTHEANSDGFKSNTSLATSARNAKGKMLENELTNFNNMNGRVFLTVTVSEKSENIPFWEMYFAKSIGECDFEIRSPCATSQSFRLFFPSVKVAQKAASLIMKKANGLIKELSKISSCSSLAEHSKPDCMESIRTLHKEQVKLHFAKISQAEEEFEELQRGGSKNMSILKTVKKKLDSLHDMYQLFSMCFRKLEKQIASYPNNDPDSKELCELKESFARECNFFNGGLPIYAQKSLILEKIQKNQVTILVAHTGSGKSTQLVQYLYHEGYAKKGKIVCTQPRNIAVVSISQYVSGQMNSVLGEIVGYETSVRKKVSNFTKIAFMSDYVLLRKCCDKNEVDELSCVIIDEVHERSLYTDLLLGMMKRILADHPSMKVIITSATINPEVFVDYFDVPSDVVIEVPGQLYPVEVIYQSADAFLGWNYLEACVDCALELHYAEGKGEILVFLTSPAEAEEAKQLFEKRLSRKKARNRLEAVVLTVHGRLEIEDQLRIFDRIPDSRKVVFATNSAETSLTIPNIKYVIDCGMSKQLFYDRENKRSMLLVDFISRSSANQRKGRAGRTQLGYCYRMYTEENYENMVEEFAPEIMKAPLQTALLRILSLHIQPMDFDFLTQPPQSGVRDALHSLKLLGAVKNDHLTNLGRKIALFSLQPRLGKLVVEGIESEFGYDCLVMAAMISASSRVFVRNDDNKKEADKVKYDFCDPRGDFCTYLIVFHEWSCVYKNKRSEWCKKHFINFQTMESVERTIRELYTIVNSSSKFEIKIRPVLCEMKKFIEMYDRLESIIFRSFSENLFIYSGHIRAGYVSPYYDGTYYIHPSSAISYLPEKMPAFLVCTDILKTSRDFLLNIVPISESTIVTAFQENHFEFSLDLLKRLRVISKTFKPFGEVILRRYVLGQEGSKMKKIEEEIHATLKTNSMHIEVASEKGEIIIHAEEHLVGKIFAALKKAIDQGHNDLLTEESIRSAQHSMNFNFVIGPGANVQDVILPGESREVLVKSSSKEFNTREILRLLERIGPVVKHSIQAKLEVSATFRNVASANKALELLKNRSDCCVVQGNVCVPIRMENLSVFKIQVTWRRLNCIGSGYVEFADSESRIQASYRLTALSFFINKRYVIVEASRRKNKNELYMRNLPSNVDEATVKTALLNHLPSHLKVKGIELTWRSPYDSSQTDLMVQKKLLQQTFAPYTASKDIFIDLKYPEKGSLMWEAVVSFTNFEDGEKAMSKLKDTLVLSEHKAKLTLILKFKVNCKSSIHAVLKTSIADIRKTYSGVTITETRKKGQVAVEVVCDNVKLLGRLRQEFDMLFRGHHINCSNNPKLIKLFSKGSHNSFQEIEVSTKTVILSDSLRKVITVYGPPNRVQEAEQYILNLEVGSSVWKTKIFDLFASSMPLGFTKLLYRRYGFNLNSFRTSYKLSNAYLNISSHQLVLEGSVKSINQAEEHLEELCAELNKAPQGGKAGDKKECELCPICLDEISILQSIRLENCGHAVCKLCLHLQIKSEVFPVVCVKEGCGELYFVEDFRKIFLDQPSLSEPFEEAALNFYIKQNPSKVRYCPSPNCPMIYRPNSGEVICQGCDNMICTQCHSLYHQGMSCEMFQNIQKDEDYPLKVWLQADAANRKFCPSCSAAIEKDGGCNHVTCGNCQRHICWNCMRLFEESEQVYDHMPMCGSRTA